MMVFTSRFFKWKLKKNTNSAILVKFNSWDFQGIIFDQLSGGIEV